MKDRPRIQLTPKSEMANRPRLSFGRKANQGSTLLPISMSKTASKNLFDKLGREANDIMDDFYSIGGFRQPGMFFNMFRGDQLIGSMPSESMSRIHMYLGGEGDDFIEGAIQGIGKVSGGVAYDTVETPDYVSQKFRDIKKPGVKILDDFGVPETTILGRLDSSLGPNSIFEFLMIPHEIGHGIDNDIARQIAGERSGASRIFQDTASIYDAAVADLARTSFGGLSAEAAEVRRLSPAFARMATSKDFSTDTRYYPSPRSKLKSFTRSLIQNQMAAAGITDMSTTPDLVWPSTPYRAVVGSFKEAMGIVADTDPGDFYGQLAEAMGRSEAWADTQGFSTLRRVGEQDPRFAQKIGLMASVQRGTLGADLALAPTLNSLRQPLGFTGAGSAYQTGSFFGSLNIGFKGIKGSQRYIEEIGLSYLADFGKLREGMNQGDVLSRFRVEAALAHKELTANARAAGTFAGSVGFGDVTGIKKRILELAGADLNAPVSEGQRTIQFFAQAGLIDENGRPNASPDYGIDDFKKLEARLAGMTDEEVNDALRYGVGQKSLLSPVQRGGERATFAKELDLMLDTGHTNFINLQDYQLEEIREKGLKGVFSDPDAFIDYDILSEDDIKRTGFYAEKGIARRLTQEEMAELHEIKSTIIDDVRKIYDESFNAARAEGRYSAVVTQGPVSDQGAMGARISQVTSSGRPNVPVQRVTPPPSSSTRAIMGAASEAAAAVARKDSTGMRLAGAAATIFRRRLF